MQVRVEMLSTYILLMLGQIVLFSTKILKVQQKSESASLYLVSAESNHFRISGINKYLWWKEIQSCLIYLNFQIRLKEQQISVHSSARFILNGWTSIKLGSK